MLTFELVWRFLVSLLNSGHLLLLGSQLGAQPALEAFGPAKKKMTHTMGSTVQTKIVRLDY